MHMTFPALTKACRLHLEKARFTFCVKHSGGIAPRCEDKDKNGNQRFPAWSRMSSFAPRCPHQGPWNYLDPARGNVGCVDLSRPADKMIVKLQAVLP
ncbi:hypothetical protein RRG08_021436 [Elysia crispata]|uniref:Uncharacterized protein n=1 Tax=Elysia crispata TaxID=231223 RepID=A0AAE1A5W5_9GAST|nr:hypothetical protein RRG08_021436 [Elysia crispata]